MQNARYVANLLKRHGAVAPDRVDEAVTFIEREAKGQKLTDVLVRRELGRRGDRTTCEERRRREKMRDASHGEDRTTPMTSANVRHTAAARRGVARKTSERACDWKRALGETSPWAGRSPAASQPAGDQHHADFSRSQRRFARRGRLLARE